MITSPKLMRLVNNASAAGVIVQMSRIGPDNERIVIKLSDTATLEATAKLKPGLFKYDHNFYLNENGHTEEIRFSKASSLLAGISN